MSRMSRDLLALLAFLALAGAADGPPDECAFRVEIDGAVIHVDVRSASDLWQTARGIAANHSGSLGGLPRSLGPRTIPWSVGPPL